MAATTLAVERISIDDRTVDEARDTPVTTNSTLILRAADGEETALPAELQEILLRALRSIASDGEVTIGRTPDQLTSTVAADLLGISRPTLMKWARDGEIDSFKVGSHTRFQRDEVLRVRSLRAEQQASAHQALLAFDEEHEGLLEGGSGPQPEHP